jgi:RND superfamily putative drug exporter
VALSTESLARSAAQKPWRTLGVWAVLVIVGIAITGALLGSATTEGNGEFTIEQESETAQNLLEQSELRGELRDYEVVVIRNPEVLYSAPAFRNRIDEIHAAIVGLGPDTIDDPATVPNPNLLPPEAGLVGSSEHTVRIPVALAGDFMQAGDTVAPLLELAEELSTDGFEVSIFGNGAVGADFREISENDLVVGESIGIVVALFILLFILRSFGSVWIPILVAILGIGLAYATVAVLGQFYKNFPFFVTNFMTMIGLAVGIDYTLFIVARYREERARGLDKIEAIARSSSTASRAVLFSGFTVVFALLGMLIVPTTVFFSMALGAIIVVAYTVLLVLIFLPALLSVLGDKIDAWRVETAINRGLSGLNWVSANTLGRVLGGKQLLPLLSVSAHDYDDTQSGFWNWITRAVLRRPAVFMVVTSALLVLLTVPYFQIELGFNGPETFPDSTAAKRTFNILQAEFTGGLDELAPIDVVISGDADSPETAAAVDRLVSSLESETIFRQATPLEISADGTVGNIVLNLNPVTNPDEITQFIKDVRSTKIPAANIPGDVYIGGQRAFEVDFFNLVDTWTYIVLAVVLALSFVLLTIVFRSLMVPVKAIILNLFSVGAAYGLLVLVFQEGFMADVLGFQQVPVIEAWIPLFLFAILFGLSMDYEVFLLSRIRERFDQTGNNTESVAFGLRSTAAIITGAALIMVAVFWGFTLGDLVMFQQFGFGLAVAIFVDATIIRSILVPSTMKLLGNNNWWLPQFLHWLPDVRVEGGETSHGSSSPTPYTAD